LINDLKDHPVGQRPDPKSLNISNQTLNFFMPMICHRFYLVMNNNLYRAMMRHPLPVQSLSPRMVAADATGSFGDSAKACP
jgi:hypothetical protein